MYAIIKTGGHQYKVAVGDQLDVEKLPVEAGEQVELAEVLMVSGDEGVQVGSPTVTGARVTATVVDHHRGEKIIVFKYKPKKRYRRKMGHRQDLTRLSITGITL
jgi:large subunit ribosomal protein L21